MSWSWQYEDAQGVAINPSGAPAPQSFPAQGDAESWIGEIWHELLDAGIDQVTLLEGDRVVYGPMSLHPAE